MATLLGYPLAEVPSSEKSSRPRSISFVRWWERRIEVRIAGKDLRVQTRTGYYAVSDTGAGPLTPGDMSALHGLDSNPLPFDFGFESKAYRFRSAQGAAQYSIAWEVLRERSRG